MWSDKARVALGPVTIGPDFTLSYRAGVATINGAEVPGRAFDILEAVYEVLRGTNQRLHGFLSYDLAAELEVLGPLPADDSRFPQMFFRAKAAAAETGLPRLSAETTSHLSREQFEAAVTRIVARIHAGDIFQTNLCRRLEATLPPGAEWDLFERLRGISPARYEAFVRVDEHRAVLSISPELFLRVRDGVVESEPIKGTRPRGATPEEDARLAQELLASTKDRAELAMIVDVVRNDLARVCRPGSVEVVEHAALMTLPTVHHSYSTVRGRLREGATPVDLLRAAFPAASISGAPKIEAVRAALAEEGRMRGPCMGAIGWIDGSGDLEFSVAIRTAFTEGGKVRYYAGCGITADSDPAAEWEESGHKAAAFVRALR